MATSVRHEAFITISKKTAGSPPFRGFLFGFEWGRTGLLKARLIIGEELTPWEGCLIDVLQHKKKTGNALQK